MRSRDGQRIMCPLGNTYWSVVPQGNSIHYFISTLIAAFGRAA